MPKTCLTCQATKLNIPLNQWIEEKHYLGRLKTEADYQKNYQSSVYYCSWTCMERQFDQEEAQDFAKGTCIICKDPLVVFNDTCFSQAHQKEMKYLAINTPECLKGGKHE